MGLLNGIALDVRGFESAAGGIAQLVSSFFGACLTSEQATFANVLNYRIQQSVRRRPNEMWNNLRGFGQTVWQIGYRENLGSCKGSDFARLALSVQL